MENAWKASLLCSKDLRRPIGHLLDFREIYCTKVKQASIKIVGGKQNNNAKKGLQTIKVSVKGAK